MEIIRITEVTEALCEACGRLLPQLSASLAVPDRARLRAIAGSGTSALFAARSGGRIVGLLTLAWYDVPSGRKAWIEDVVVDAAWRGRGAGRALVDAALAHAARIGAVKVMLTSRPSRVAAHALYRKAGFEVAETAVFVRKIDTE